MINWSSFSNEINSYRWNKAYLKFASSLGGRCLVSGAPSCSLCCSCCLSFFLFFGPYKCLSTPLTRVQQMVRHVFICFQGIPPTSTSMTNMAYSQVLPMELCIISLTRPRILCVSPSAVNILAVLKLIKAEIESKTVRIN